MAVENPNAPSRYLEELESGNIPPKSQWPPKIQISDRQKARNKELKAFRNRNPVPFLDRIATSEKSTVFAYKVLRLEINKMVDQGIEPEAVTIRDIAKKAAERCQVSFEGLVQYIRGPVAEVKGSAALVRMFAGIEAPPYGEEANHVEARKADEIARIKAAKTERAEKEEARREAAAKGRKPAIKTVAAELYSNFTEAIAAGEDPDPEEWIEAAAKGAGVDIEKLARYIEKMEEDPNLEARVAA